MNEEKLRSAYETHLMNRPERSTDCVAPEALLAIVENTAPESERLQTLRHVGSCRSCRADLDLLYSAGAAAEEAVAPPLWRRPRLLAAAALLLFVGAAALWQTVRGVPDLPRTAAPDAPRLLAPAEDVIATGPVTLVWSALPTARRYEVEILRATGEVVLERATSDTVLVVPDNTLTAGEDYRWWVVAVLRDGTRASLTRRLRLSTP